MNVLQLIAKIAIQGVDDVVAGLEKTEEKTEKATQGIKKTSHAVKEAEEEFKHFKAPVIEALFALDSIRGAMGEVSEILTKFSGIEAATEWNHLAQGLAVVTGNAEAARDMLKEVKEMAAGTGFNAQDFAKIAPELLNAGVSEDRIVGNLKSSANLAAMGNLTRDQMPAFLESMMRLKNLDHPMVRQLEGMNAMPIKDLVNAATGTHFKTANQADDFLASTGRGQAYDILLKGADALGKDAAAMQKASDPAMALAKSLETLEEVMEPTGELLLKVLGPVGAGFGWLAEQIEHLNAITGGSAGLIAIILVLIRHHKLLVSSFRAAIRYTQELAEAVERYGAAAEMAAHTTHGGALAAEGAAHGATAVREAESIGAVARMTNSLKSATTAVRAFAKNPLEAMKSVKIAEVLKVAKLAKVADVASFAVGLGLETLGDHMRGEGGRQTRGGSITQGVGEGIGFGGLGFFGGPWVGLATTLVGAIAGGVIGNNRYNHAPKEEEHKKALEENTNALIDLKGSVVGGGPRGRAAFSQMQIERGVARAMAGLA